jgi:arsenate reductase
MRTVIFACVHNAGRSQMAAAWLNALAERAAPGVPAQVRAVSAGTSPAAHVHPEVLEVMKEVGIDLSAAKPQKLTASLAENADLLVTMGCGDECPFVPGLRVEDWPLEDPKGKPIERVRQIRSEIRAQVQALLDRLNTGA